MLKHKLLFIILSSVFCSAFSQNRNLSYTQDSVMAPPSGFSPPPLKMGFSGLVLQNQYNYSFEIETQYSACPAGYKGSNGNEYPSAQRNVAKVFDGARLVKVIPGPWQEMDNDCAKTVSRNVSCPPSYIGSITQERTVASDGDASSWTTVNDSCVYVPPPPPPAPPPSDPVPSPSPIPSPSPSSPIPSPSPSSPIPSPSPSSPAPVVCASPHTYCEGFGTGGGGSIYQYGYYHYDSNDNCKPSKEVVGNERFGSTEVEGCPQPFGNL